jgi:hypothetical protein
MDGRYTMEQILHMQEVGMFRDDMRRDMVAMGFPLQVIGDFVWSDAVRNKNIVQLWRDHGRDYPDYFHQYFGKFAALIKE